MNAKVTILDANVVTKPYEFTDEKTGELRKGTTRSQKAKLEVGGFAYPYQVRIEGEGEGAGHALGVYELDFAAMAEVKNNKLGLSKFAVLRPVK